MTIISLHNALDLDIPHRLRKKINQVLTEDDQYAADEIVELAEEILNQVAARGFLIYLTDDDQKEVYNDFLLQLFNSSGHDYNAGPLYRWSANMVKHSPRLRETGIEKFYWENDQLSERMEHYSKLRNQVMHGFFLLPPEKNRQEAQLAGELVCDLAKSGFFEATADLHFFGSDGYTGRWHVKVEKEWQKLTGETAFGKLCSRILKERSDTFWEEQHSIFSKADGHFLPSEIQDFILHNQRGAVSLWVHPRDDNRISYFANIGNWLQNQPETLTICYQLEDAGLNFTSGFLLERLAILLNTSGKTFGKDKKSEDRVRGLRKENNSKVVVLIDRFETCLFSPQHVSRITNFLFENNILLIAISHHYAHFDKIFNRAIEINHNPVIPTPEECEKGLHNYLRFKGPFVDREEDRAQILQLREIVARICSGLQSGMEIYARRFADEFAYPMESVHEIFAVLQPWIPIKHKPFEQDTVDELYGFPSTITEATPIYLALGRRDLKFEYQHHVLSL
jgi:hypothetical protein